jgi:hypothetical protein
VQAKSKQSVTKAAGKDQKSASKIAPVKPTNKPKPTSPKKTITKADKKKAAAKDKKKKDAKKKGKGGGPGPLGWLGLLGLGGGLLLFSEPVPDKKKTKEDDGAKEESSTEVEPQNAAAEGTAENGADP